MASAPVASRKTHETLDPKGVTFRESRDSDEHPTSLAIAVLFDVTGSMLHLPQNFQEQLNTLMGLLMRKGYVEHPHILPGGIGDAWSDRSPLQIGQFESDNRVDEHLRNIYLEGGGGGQRTESYELAMYFMARHTALDCLEKRGRKGYLFLTGDEMPYPFVQPTQVEQIIGDRLGEPIPVEQIAKELQEKFEVYFIFPRTGASHSLEDDIPARWRELFGQNVIYLDDVDAICETIALTIGLAEGAIEDEDEGARHLVEIGATTSRAAAASRAVATLPRSAAVAKSDTRLPGLAADSGDSGNIRL